MPHFRAMVSDRGNPLDGYNGWSPTPEQYRAAAAAEFGMIEMIDDGVGQILTRLRQHDLEAQTVVMFTSDHGDMFGDHGVMLKHAMHYDACTHVPLVMDVPWLQAGTNAALVSTLDLSSTILDLAGLPGYGGMQGQSLVPLLTGLTSRVRDALLIEEDETFSLAGLQGPIRMRTALTEKGRITLYRSEEHGEVFDHRADPLETENLFDRTRNGLQAELQDALMWLLVDAADEGISPVFLG
jgi:arylsulfatase A-like enzyme